MGQRMTRYAFVIALLVGGCAPKPFGLNGLQYPKQPIVVRYATPGSQIFVSPDWRVDNFLLSDTGEIRAEKENDEYTFSRKADYDGDGREEVYVAPTYILKLLHRKNAGVLWSQMVPLDLNEKERNLDVLVNDYVESLSGAGFYAVSVPSGKVEVHARQYATKIVDKKPRKVGRFEGLEATIELANLDQLKLDPASRSAKIRVVFLRTDYVTRLYQTTTVDVPLLLVLGLHAQPAYFDATAPDFDSFVGAFELKEKAPH